MAKVQHIQRARASKTTRQCSVCRHEIQVGEPYKKIDKKTGPVSGYTLVWCKDHNPKPSDQASGRTADMYRIDESISEAIMNNQYDLSTEEGRQELCEVAAVDWESFGDEIDESAENIESGFGHGTAQSEIMRETANSFRDWAERFRNDLDTAPDDDNPEEFATTFLDAFNDLMGEQPELELQA